MFSCLAVTIPRNWTVVLPLPVLAVVLLLVVLLLAVSVGVWVVVPLVFTYSILIQPLLVRPQPFLVSRMVTTSPLL